MTNSDHVIEYDSIPDDIQNIFQITDAETIRASADGHWIIKLKHKPGTNAVMVESAIRAAGMPAFNGAPYTVTLRAITESEIPLFDEDDQAILRRVIDHAGSADNKSVISRILDGIDES